MALPEITVPDGTPAFLLAGHGITESDLFANNRRGTGHSRKRRLYTVPERRVSVSLLLESDEMLIFDAWFENTLKAGKVAFSAQVASDEGTGKLWWRAVWDAPYSADPMHLGRWRVSGVLLLTGEGSVDGPVSTSATLAVGLALTGSASITVNASATLSVGFGLLPSQVLPAINFGFDLVFFVPSRVLREDSSFLLREDGYRILRES